jgi:hypothetical protein
MKFGEGNPRKVSKAYRFVYQDDEGDKIFLHWDLRYYDPQSPVPGHGKPQGLTPFGACQPRPTVLVLMNP